MKLLSLLLDTYKEEFDVNLAEGLIKTTQIDQTLKLLQNYHREGYIFSKDKNAFFASINKVTPEDLQKGLLKDADRLGWFPSYLETEEYKGKWNLKYVNDKPVKIRFEAKFDEELVDSTKIPKTLYHITPSQNVPGILKIGLVPKSRSKLSYHPERVYLGTTVNSVERLKSIQQIKTGIRDWTILQIETDWMPYLRLFKDPNYAKYGYYTENNIPPQAIKKVKDLK